MTLPGINYTPEGAVSISYATLISAPSSLSKSIEQAFGSHPESLGIVIVRDLPPEFVGYRDRLLKLGHKFAQLEEKEREKYADPTTRFSFGWSHGKEIMNGKLDILKGSYYANIAVDRNAVTISASEKAAYPEYYGSNIWPSESEHGIEGFESAFNNLGSFIFEVGYKVAIACQPFALSYFEELNLSLPDLIKTSQTTKARLLHYFPPVNTDMPALDDEPIDSWCGFHLDHSMLTGLCSAMYLSEVADGSPITTSSPSAKSGLYIRTRGGNLIKVSIPENCLAFQTGEALEIATGGKLLATPHCVRVGMGSKTAKVSRETFALFMQPNTDQRLSSSITFGQFSKQVFDEHYNEKF